MTDIVAEEAPDLANQLAAQALAPEGRSVELPDVPTPPDTHVVLPAGYWSMTEDRLVKHAEVRELTGEDEEALARVADKQPRKFFSVILERGVVTIGGEPVTRKVLDGLTVGDVDALLLAIRYVTYGTDVDLSVKCPSCEYEYDLNLDLQEAIPVNSITHGHDLNFTVKLRNGREALCTLATYADQQEVLDGKDRTVAEINSLLLSRVITQLDGEMVTLTDVRNLGMKDRRTLVDAISKHTVGPKLTDVKEKCPECSDEISLPLSMVDLFQLQ